MNHVLALADARARPWLVDLDTVTPFYRSRDLRDLLEKAGVRLVAPRAPFGAADLPAIPAEVGAVLGSDREPVVVDLGGDAAGTRVLGAWRDQLSASPHRALYVVNARRPFSGDVQSIVHGVRRLAAAARISVTGLVSNTHLGDRTTRKIIQDGDRLIRQAAEELGLPVAFVAARRDLADGLDVPGTVVAIDNYLHLASPWARWD
ncbi:MAG TPA: hypothetical protein VLK32_06905 [Bacillota bacterium]|nr:hypothetical protein [Bacillota bacterium]